MDIHIYHFIIYYYCHIVFRLHIKDHLEFIHYKGVKSYRRNICTLSLIASIYIFNPSSNKSPFPNHSLIVFLRLHKLFCSRRRHHNHNRWHLDENSDLQSQYCLYLQYGNISFVVFYYENYSIKCQHYAYHLILSNIGKNQV